MNESPAELAPLVSKISHSLARRYDYHIPADDIQQQMWLVYYESLDHNPDAWQAHPVDYQARMMAWRTRDWIREQFSEINPTSLLSEDGEEWEFVALEADLDPLLQLVEEDRVSEYRQAIAQTLACLAEKYPASYTVALGLMDGQRKRALAQAMGVGDSAISHHVKVIRSTFTTMLSQAVAA